MASPDDDSGRYEWRETYFVLFESARRPSLKAVEEKVLSLGGNFRITSPTADEEGRIESLNVLSPRDHSALEIDYLSGDEVREQVKTLVADFRRAERGERERLDRIRRCDARFEVMHFEELVEAFEGDEEDEVFDPSALLVVLDALIELTGGVGVDPQAGTLL